MKTQRTFASRACILLLCLTPIVLAVSAMIIVHDNWMDWDMQRYVTQVRIHEKGDLSFSYPHNLLKTWLCGATRLIQPVTGDFSPLRGAQFLTTCLTAATVLFISLCTLSITRSFVASSAAGLVWFLIPGNLLMMTTLEDNAWSNAFNAAFLFAACSASSISLPFVPERRRNRILWSAVAGAVLALGINVHQQLAILFWAFVPLLVISCDPWGYPARKAVAGILLPFSAFLAAYLAFSLAQNLLAFGRPELTHSLVRLFSQPYVETFPKLWYFTAGVSNAEWMARIFQGWNRLLLFSETTPPAFYYAAIPSAFLALVCLVRLSRRRGTLIFLAEARTFAWLFAAIAVHLPYSLLYEPQNPERWDHALPALLVTTSVLIFYACRRCAPESSIERRPSLFSLRTAAVAVWVLTLGASAIQCARCVLDTHSDFSGSESTRELSALVSHLSRSEDLSSRHVVLCSRALTHSDIQVRLTYHFPRVTVITLDNRLRPLYTSHALQLRSAPRGPGFAAMWFSPEDHFSATASVYEAIETQMPDFVAKRRIQRVEVR